MDAAIPIIYLGVGAVAGAVWGRRRLAADAAARGQPGSWTAEDSFLLGLMTITGALTWPLVLAALAIGAGLRRARA